jgi:dATP/dGTP diphosphohydrolase
MGECSDLSEFASGAVRSSAVGKAPISQLDVEMLRQAALVMEFGEIKYSRGNWRKGIPYNRCLDSALRHLLSFKEGETLDPESGIAHLGHAVCNLMFLLRYEADNRVDLDDRDKITGTSK